MPIEEVGDLVERDYVHPVVEIGMGGTGDDQQLLRFQQRLPEVAEPDTVELISTP